MFYYGIPEDIVSIMTLNSCLESVSGHFKPPDDVGLYLNAVNGYINESYVEGIWRLIEAWAKIPHHKFEWQQMYNDSLVLRLAKAAGKVLGKIHDKMTPGYEKFPIKRGIVLDMFPLSVIPHRDMTMYHIRDSLKEAEGGSQICKANSHLCIDARGSAVKADVVESKQKVNILKLSKEEPEKTEESEKPKKEERDSVLLAYAKPRIIYQTASETVKDMIKMDVDVNDLNLHDSSRELILAGTQQSAELQLALD
ncbi:hypothetical protein P4O66_010363 [Electrophorus voltai]|uniref:guanylate cyclase n=1 Tax=Electrophorus voltai TaxID=2609070 RepID=A0AAD8ZA27_9TELE|nr:hypothetical protein P4O66_010363 [Electrophorus voltai]